ncbi:MAG TPA: 2-dehydropantoate 2-reductase [Candidatus Baltobacteraceae bacterium]
MRVAVVGAGAIGGFLAAALARGGNDVAVVARGAHLAAIQSNGLTVRGDLGSFSARVAADSDLSALGSFDAFLLTFKAHHWPSFIDMLAEHAGADATIVTLQNGVPFWFVRQPPLRSVDPQGRVGTLFPDSQVVGGAVHISARVSVPGVVVQSGGTRVVIGDPNGANGARAEALAAAMRDAGLEPHVDPDIRQTVWLKLANNVGLNPISALEGRTLRAILSDPRSRDDARELMLEVLAVGRSLGVVAEVDVDARLAYAARLADVKTSMLQDLELGRPLELDPMLGAVIELAERYGVEVPRVRDTYRRTRELERLRGRT